MNIPKYPDGFDECDRSKRLSEEELDKKINIEIKNMINYMSKNGTENYSKAFEDVLIMIDRIYEDDQTYYEISVAKQHSRAIVR
ncbi:hypothetical protein [Alkalihalobacillus sp. BA299]|uniref:hypothetical protein n=1 Tax=Alkalihalobacillus sp. BA299 TaxID=2815938 RepID=UPI001AD958E7|nr:hypothetical protein [Alkalihalobacillus sp. BA299]